MKSTALKLLPSTKLEWFFVVAIIGILIAMLVPQEKWAADGLIEIPVRVVVFDTEISVSPIRSSRGERNGKPGAEHVTPRPALEFFAILADISLCVKSLIVPLTLPSPPRGRGDI